MVKTTYIIGIIAIIIVAALAFVIPANQATITIEDGTLNPAELTVNQGTTVTWVVKDTSDDMFMITSNDTGPVEGKFLFMSDHLTTGGNFSYTFKEKGTFHYYDMDHMDDEKLTGTIIVT
jgi:plastocyanin